MFHELYKNLESINQVEILIPITILAVMLVSISKSGFGGGLGGLGFPLMVLVLPPKLALAVFLPLTLLTDIWVVYVWRKFFLFQIIWMMALGGIIGQIICWMFFDYLDDKTILLLIGLMALTTSTKYFIVKLDILKKTNNNLKTLDPTLFRAIIWCSLSGFASFIAWAGSIPAQIFLLRLGIDRKNFVAAMSFYFFFINLFKIPFFLDLKIINQQSLTLSFILIPILPLGIFIGKWLNLKLSDNLFYNISHIALFLCGINLILKSIN